MDWRNIRILGIRNMFKRSRLEIYLDIVEIIERGVGEPTRIMYETHLSWAMLQGMLATLYEGGFIKEEIEGNSRKYKMTEKGRNVLSRYLKSCDETAMDNQIIVYTLE